MSSLPTYFRDFLSEVRPSKSQLQDMRTGHSALRRRLNEDDRLKPILISDFLQGSYRRATATRPSGAVRSDVDIVVVTNLDPESVSPAQALQHFVPFLEKHYEGKYRLQGRSIGIELSYVDLDLVVTAAPSEVDQKALAWAAVRASDTPEEVTDWRLNRLWVPMDERHLPGAKGRQLKAAEEASWKAEPLLIPDREASSWEPTNPLAQIEWTFEKSRATGGHFVNVVKSIKWWKKVKHPSPKHPKSYPLEHLVGDCCPDSIGSVAEGVVLTLEEIRDRFARYAQAGSTPYLPDRGVDQDVLKRVSGEDFARFHEHCAEAADLARRAYDEDDLRDSAKLWRRLLGDKFPEPPESKGAGGAGPAILSGGFTERTDLSVPPRGRFA